MSPPPLATDRGRPFGFAAGFRSGDRAGALRTLAQLRALGVEQLRTPLRWADYLSEGGRAWYHWLLPTLAAELTLLPCITAMPPALGLAPHPGAPPRDARALADFVERLAAELGDHFAALQLMEDPGTPDGWDRGLDPTWERLADSLGEAARRLRKGGRQAVLPAAGPLDPTWLRGMADLGYFDHADAVAVQGPVPAGGRGWEATLACARRTLAGAGHHPELWLMESGRHGRRHDLTGELRAFDAAARSGADRVYWCRLREAGAGEGSGRCESGLTGSDGRPVLLQRLLADGGVGRVRELLARTELRIEAGRELRPTLITGGAGFIGSNLADRLLTAGEPVVVLDSLTRPGTEQNLRWLARRHGVRLTVRIADLREPQALAAAVRDARRVFHFAAQVAVTTSLENPLADFEVNGRGTLNLLEAVRAREQPPPLIFTSTNKVYGHLTDLRLTRRGERWEPEEPLLAARGLGEERPLEFGSPYGCSKGVADQYTLDYARTYGLPTAVFRMSCIYGPRQFGNEDQGWVAHFLIKALRGEPITLYGDGRQVRDILFVEDLLEGLLAAEGQIDRLRGRAFNIGGGPQNALSLLELIHRVERLTGRRQRLIFDEWRAADQRWFVADSSRFREATGWRPRVGIDEGIKRLFDWLATQQGDAAAPNAAGGRA